MTTPRIALLLPRLSRYGGVEGFGWRLARELAADGLAVDFICARVENDPPPGVRPVTVGRAGVVRAGKVAWFALAAERARAAGNYDLSIGLGKTLRQDVLRISGGPLSVFWELSARAWPAGPARLLKTLSRRLDPVSAVIARIEREQLRHAKHVIAVSHKTVEWIQHAHPWFDASRITVIYNRPDLDRFHAPTDAERGAARERFGMPEGMTAVTLAGTAFPRKGLGGVVGAMAQLPENFHLFVAGGRNPGRFARQARALGLEGRVRFLGRVDDMVGLYHATDVFAMPSLYDTCSNTILEALASGCRVIGSVDDGSSFFLPERWRAVQADDPAELAERIRAAAAEPAPGPFTWPADVPSGLEPYVRFVRERLGR
ncbi:MAG: glycosyltransferase family 4 protein [Desulfovibrionaceae bacterium]|nr:glycosyltransferase family 4 protein [Desulfovibrionaceae bacterium]